MRAKAPRARGAPGAVRGARGAKRALCTVHCARGVRGSALAREDLRLVVAHGGDELVLRARVGLAAGRLAAGRLAAGRRLGRAVQLVGTLLLGRSARLDHAGAQLLDAHGERRRRLAEEGGRLRLDLHDARRTAV